MARVSAAVCNLLLLAALACDDSTAPPASSPPVFPSVGLPPNFVLLAEASGTDQAGLNIDCKLDLHIELTKERRGDDRLVEYDGRLGGGAGRSVLAPDGSGLGLFADLVGPVVARRFAPDSFELELPEIRKSESRFWRGISYFAGTLRPSAPWAGLWQCAPFDITEGGYVDTTGVAVGTWRIASTGP